MYRIIIVLAIFSVGMMIVALMLGLQIGNLESSLRAVEKDQDEFQQLDDRKLLSRAETARLEQLRAPREEKESLLRFVDIHRMAGIAAVLSVMLVNSIIITYFVGTSRWCKEVAQTYSLPQRYILESAALKRKTWPWALVSMFAMIVIASLGAAADPIVQLTSRTTWVTVHLYATMSGIALVCWSFFVQWNNIHTNHGIIEQVLAAVKKVREERGQPVDTE